MHHIFLVFTLKKNSSRDMYLIYYIIFQKYIFNILKNFFLIFIIFKLLLVTLSKELCL